MIQKVQHKEVTTDGVKESFVVITARDIKWDTNPVEVEMTIADAMELHRLLGNKLGEIPA
jgi:hypothetical protein